MEIVVPYYPAWYLDNQGMVRSMEKGRTRPSRSMQVVTDDVMEDDLFLAIVNVANVDDSATKVKKADVDASIANQMETKTTYVFMVEANEKINDIDYDFHVTALI